MTLHFYIIFLFLTFFSTSHAQEINEKNILQGNLQELNKAFIKLSKSDGNNAEELDILIGKTISLYPTNFLKAYEKNKKHVKGLDSLVSNLGPEFVDDFPRQALEIRKRIQALKAIKSKRLKPLALKCIEQLEKHLKIIEA